MVSIKLTISNQLEISHLILCGNKCFAVHMPKARPKRGLADANAIVLNAGAVFTIIDNRKKKVNNNICKCLTNR